MADHSQQCPRCHEDARLRLREFSDQAAAALLVWEELSKKDLGQPICDACYEELRDVLIDRASELEEAAKQPIPEPKEEKVVVSQVKTTATAKAKPASKVKQVAKAKTASKPKAVAKKKAAKPVAKKAKAKTAAKAKKAKAKKKIKRAG